MIFGAGQPVLKQDNSVVCVLAVQKNHTALFLCPDLHSVFFRCKTPLKSVLQHIREYGYQIHGGGAGDFRQAHADCKVDAFLLRLFLIGKKQAVEGRNCTVLRDSLFLLDPFIFFQIGEDTRIVLLLGKIRDHGVVMMKIVAHLLCVPFDLLVAGQLGAQKLLMQLKLAELVHTGCLLQKIEQQNVDHQRKQIGDDDDRGVLPSNRELI